jgi:WhiB family redox-sensing transcriptional regulator
LAYADARQVCLGCDVREKCLKYAMRNNIHEGMWGGYTPQERDRLFGDLD